MASSQTNLAARLAAVLASRGLEGRRRPPRAGQVDRPGEEQAGTLELGGHVGELPAETLELTDRTAPDLAVAHVPDRVLERPLGGPDAHRCVSAALVVEVPEEELERVGVGRVAGQQDVVLTDHHPVEGHLGLGGGMDPHAPVAPGDLHAVAVHRDDHRADALRSVATRPPAPDQDPAGHVPERRVVLVPVEPPAAVPVLGQRAAHVLDGRTGVGLGDADAHDAVAVGHPGEPPVLQGIPPEMLDPAGRTVVGELAADGGRDVVPGDLLEHDGRLDITQTRVRPTVRRW